MRLPKSIINGLIKFSNWSKWSYFDLPNYMLRHYVIVTPWFSVRQHTILRSDLERDLHNHPFSSISVILSGSYTEVLEHPYGGPHVRKTRKPGDVIFRSADTYHRIECGFPVTTLFITGRKAQEWGFKVQGQFVHWKDYLKLND